MNKRSFFVGLGVLVAFFISGCSQQVRPSSKSYLGTERVFDKNYSLGQKQVAYVGQAVLKVKDYRVNRYSSTQMRASHDFTIASSPVTLTGSRNTNYEVRGETTLDDKTYTVVSIPGGLGGMGALINADGSVYNRVLIEVPSHGASVVTSYTFTVSPPGLRFVPVTEEEISLDSGYLNYELIYGGTDGKSITLTYREYTSQDVARPAFFQNVVYEAGKDQVRFRDTVVQIHEATNERIVFTVKSDGLTP